MKTLRERHAELVNLRNENAYTRTRHFGVGGDKQETKEPVYDVKKLDKAVTTVATEIRKLEMALKQTNAATVIQGYEQDDSVLGQVE